MGWKNMFIGEKMPDKDDPQYRQRYETEVQAGRKFAKTMKLDVLAAKVQLFANDHKRLFLYLVFGVVLVGHLLPNEHLLKSFCPASFHR